MDDTEVAYWLAVGAHGGQMYGEEPYVGSHLFEVVSVLISFGFTDPFWIIVGWLHDTFEDTGLTAEIVSALFGKEVAETIFAVSGFGETRKIRNADMYAKIDGNARAAIVKAADRIVNKENSKLNAPSLYKMYRREDAALVPLVAPHLPQEMLDYLVAL